MRHRIAGRALSRSSSHRGALLRNQVTALLERGRIVTTEAKAREVRPMAEKVITLGKRGSLHARRQAAALLYDGKVLRRVFDELAMQYQNRNGGYTRIVKLGPRLGDGAHMAQIELVEDGPIAAAPAASPAAPARRRRRTATPTTAVDSNNGEAQVATEASDAAPAEEVKDEEEALAVRGQAPAPDRAAPAI